MQRISADIIHTNAGPPLQNHCVVIDENGLVRDVLPATEIEADRHLAGSLIPGFVNAHCHLELSHTDGLVPAGKGFVEFALELFEKREADIETVQLAAAAADEAMHRNGIQAIGDISNGTTVIDVKRNSKIRYHTFAEALGFREADAEKAFSKAESVYNAHRKAGLSVSIAPHAPYSMSRGLMSRLARWYEKHDSIAAMHYFESVAEIEFCIYGTGEINRIIEFLGYPTHEAMPYGEAGPRGALNYLTDANRLILVHNTFANDTDIGIAHALFGDQLWLCTCPNANMFIEDDLPEYDLWREHTQQICIGTDSLASNRSLSIWDEMQTIHRHHPEIPFEEMLTWATINGAKAIGMDDDFGRIDMNRKPGLIWLDHAAHQPVWEAAPKRIV